MECEDKSAVESNQVGFSSVWDLQLAFGFNSVQAFILIETPSWKLNHLAVERSFGGDDFHD